MVLQTADRKPGIVVPQWLTGIGVTILMIQAGCTAGWASPSIARLTAPDSSAPLSPQQASWVASLLNLGKVFGGITGGVAAYYIGSRRSILVASFPVTIGWCIIAFTKSFEWLCFARFCCGLCLGMALATFPLYIGEVSMPKIRGALVSLATVGTPFGQALASVCGSYLSISSAAIVYLALSLLLMILFICLPESPHHLVKRRKREDAKRSINWYRAGREVDIELDAVEAFIASDSAKSYCDKLRQFEKSGLRKATLNVIVLYVFKQLSGLNVVLFFMEPILLKAKFTLISPSLLVIITNACGVLTSAISIFLIDRYGRRLLLLISGVGATLSMLGLTCHFLLIGSNIVNFQWLPMCAMLLFMTSFFFGLFPVPSTVLSETFPADTKSMVACIAILTSSAMSFTSTKTYQPLVDLIGEAYVFLIYAFFCALIIPYSLFVMPETKGKTLQQIQDELIRM